MATNPIVKIDQDVFGRYLDAFVQQVTLHYDGLYRYARTEGLSEEFSQKTEIAALCAQDCAARLKFYEEDTSIDVLNSANISFRSYARIIADFGDDPLNKREERFKAAISTIYLHEQSSGFLGSIDNKRLSIQALHDYAEAQTLHYAAMRRRRLAPDLIGRIEQYGKKLHEIVDRLEKTPLVRAPEDNIVTLNFKKH